MCSILWALYIMYMTRILSMHLYVGRYVTEQYSPGNTREKLPYCGLSLLVMFYHLLTTS